MPVIVRILITWGSKRGGTAGIAQIVAEELRREGFDVTARPAEEVGPSDGFDAAIVGGALYANRWHRAARRFVARNAAHLRTVPVWFFSSGPLDDSARAKTIAPVRQVADLMDRVGALGHVTFGGRLAPDATGFPARAMAKTHAGDWRDPDRIRAWTAELARRLPDAQPGRAIAQPGRSLIRLAAHAVVGWALCAAAMETLLHVAPPAVAIAIHDVLAVVVFAALALHYFRARGARGPLVVASAFAGIVAALDVSIIAGLVGVGVALVRSVAGFWLPLAAIFAVTAAVGAIESMVPPARAGA